MYCTISLSVANKDSNNDNDVDAIAIAFDWTNGRKAIKVLSGVGSERDYTWKEIALDIPSFYKDYVNLSSLANALGGLYFRGVMDNGDVNTLDSGIYGVNAHLSNAPECTGASMLIVMIAGGWLRCDVIFDRSNRRMFYRFKFGSNGFEEWQEIS